MRDVAGKGVSGELSDGRCDTRIWSGECEHGDTASVSEKYLCAACGIVSDLDHEVRHEIFPHISGDTDNLY